MENLRTEQEFKDGFKETTGFSWVDAPSSFDIFKRCVMWADNHPTKFVQSMVDEVILLNKEIQELKNELQKYDR